jgi:hypothetical protein
MGISKKSVNTGIMRIGLICSVIAGIVFFFVGFMVFEMHNLRYLFAVGIGFIGFIVVLFLFKIMSWVLAGFFD